MKQDVSSCQRRCSPTLGAIHNSPEVQVQAQASMSTRRSSSFKKDYYITLSGRCPAHTACAGHVARGQPPHKTCKSLSPWQ